VTMVHGDSIICYPLSIITPGRQFVYYNHDIWGPTRKIPYKRTYTQCNMSFIIHNDWAERIFLETWANDAIKNLSGLNLAAGAQLDSTGNELTDADATAAVTAAVQESASSSNAYSIGNYGDYTDYLNGLGTVVIKCLDSKDKSKVNLQFKLTEAYPAVLGPITLASDGSGYATFNVTFQFRDYTMISGG
jgi:hypothetical protein